MYNKEVSKSLLCAESLSVNIILLVLFSQKSLDYNITLLYCKHQIQDFTACPNSLYFRLMNDKLGWKFCRDGCKQN